MKPELRAKASIALIVSLIAFGFGTGASIFSGLAQIDTNSSSFTLNPTSDLPTIYNTKNTSNSNTNSPTSTSNTNTQTSSSSSQNDNQNSATTPSQSQTPSTQNTTSTGNRT